MITNRWNRPVLDSHLMALMRLIVIATLAPQALQAADRTWSNASGGAFGDTANWVGGFVPGALDTANFTANASYPVTFGNSITNASAYFYAPGGTVSLDIGAGNLYYVTYFRLQNDPGAASVDLTSGALSAYKIYLGDWATHNGNRLTVKNPGTTVVTRNDDITVGASGSGNVLIVTNGASVISGRQTYAGYNATGSGNTILVTGAGSVLGSSVANGFGVVVGRYGDNNKLVVENGGKVFFPSAGFSIGDLAGSDGNSVFVGAGCLVTNGPTANTSAYIGNKGAYNAMTVSNATFILDFNLNVGLEGVFNRLDVLDGGVVSPRTHLYVGGTATAKSNTVVVSGAGSRIATSGFDVNVGNSGHWNTLQIADGGTVEANRTLYVGVQNGSSFNKILVSGASSVLRSKGNGATYSIAVGKSGTGNSLVLSDGASFICDAGVPLSVGTDVGTSSNRVFIGSGCVATNTGLVYVGHAGDYNSMTVSNASFVAGGYTHAGYSGFGNSITICGGATYWFNGHLHVGYAAGASNNLFVATGAGTVVTNLNYDLDVGFNGSRNRMRIADGAEVTIRRSIYVGHNAGAVNNVLEIEGGTLRSLQDSSGFPSMTVNNSGRLAVYGAYSVLKTKKLDVIGGSTLDIRFGEEGFTPIDATGTVTFDATTKLTVDARAHRVEGAVVKLLNYGALSGEVLPENITLLPAGTTIDFADGKSISIKLPRGTVVVVR